MKRNSTITEQKSISSKAIADSVKHLREMISASQRRTHAALAAKFGRDFPVEQTAEVMTALQIAAAANSWR